MSLSTRFETFGPGSSFMAPLVFSVFKGVVKPVGVRAGRVHIDVDIAGYRPEKGYS